MPGKNDLDSARLSSVFALSSSRVVTPAGEMAAAIIVDGETIRDVVASSDVPSGIPVSDFGDLVISPGIVDAHVHINEPGRTEWEGFQSATASAAAGGVTTLIDMPLNSSPVTISAAALKTKRDSAAGKCHVDVGFYGGLVPGNENRIADLVAQGVLGIKTFLCDSGLDEFPASRESELRNALEILKSSRVPLLAHAEIVDPGLVPETSDVRSYEQYANSRPAEFELAAIELLIGLCREYRTPIHIVHLATSKALSLIEAAKLEGLPLTVETCPHYLCFSDDEIDDGETCFKCAPPIRSRSNRESIRAAVTSGLIETVGSDHSPCPPEMKLLDAGDFTRAWGGIAGLQLTLPVMWTIGKQQGWTTSLLADRLSQRPAEVFSLADRKGEIEPGLDADFVVWDPAKSFLVDGQKLFHQHPCTPYDGRELFGVVEKTYVRGQVVYDHGQLGPPSGKLLTRGARLPNAIANFLNGLSDQQRIEALESCCASQSWISRMASGGAFADDAEVMIRAQRSWSGLSEPDYLEAFLAHPRIGNVDTLREKYSSTKKIAGDEQAGVDTADEATLQRLAQANDEYFDKFGFIFIVCATGKSASEMLEILEQRLPNDREMELGNAADEQLKITLIRLEKLIA